MTQGLIPLSFTLMDDRFPVVRVGEEYLSYQKTGRGNPLFCLHGWAGRSLIMSMFPLEEEEGTGYTTRRLAEVPTSSMAAFLHAMYLYARETNAYARPKIKVPTIFPLPQKTFGQVAVFERLYGRCFSDLEVAPVKGEVHNPVVEDPKAFARAVLPHLGIRK